MNARNNQYKRYFIFAAVLVLTSGSLVGCARNSLNSGTTETGSNDNMASSALISGTTEIGSNDTMLLVQNKGDDGYPGPVMLCVQLTAQGKGRINWAIGRHAGGAPIVKNVHFTAGSRFVVFAVDEVLDTSVSVFAETGPVTWEVRCIEPVSRLKPDG